MSGRHGVGGRWGAVAAGIAVLVALPAVVAAVPARDDPAVPARALLDRIRASAAVPFEGYAESQGSVGLPDVPELGDVPALLGGTTRLRAWHGGPDSWRVDALQPGREFGTYRDGAGTWNWESDPGRANRVTGEPPVRLPRASDLLPSELGRRLAGGADGSSLGRLPARRVAGRDGLGLRLTPADPQTTVAAVDLWADPATGLPLRAEVIARGAATPALTTAFLDLRRTRPPASVVAFSPPAGASADYLQAPDVAAEVDRLAPYRLPDRLAGLPRRDRVGGLGGGVATYGEGFTVLTVLPLPGDLARKVFRRLSGPPAARMQVGPATAVQVATPLVSLLAVRQGRRAFLITGTVTPAVVERAAAALVANPPPRTTP